MKIKRFLLCFFVLSLVLSFCSCSAREECNQDIFLENFKESESPNAFVYSSETLYDISDFFENEEAVSLLPCAEDFTKTGGTNRTEKLLTVNIAMQYEITFFEDGGAMIYHGVCGVFEKDRQYYEVNSDYDVGLLINYIENNFSVSESEEKQ